MQSVADPTPTVDDARYGAAVIRRLPAALAVALALVAALAGCSNDNTSEPAAAPTSSAPAATSAATSPTASQTSPTPDADADAVLAFGKSRRSIGGEVTSTVYGYKQPVARSAPRPEGQAGFEWGAVDVKVCVNKDYTGQPIAVSNSRWVLVYDDDTQIGSSDTGYEAFPKPEYPWSNKELAPGRCIRGWITYPVPAKKRPAFVEYAAESEASNPPRWAVK